MEATTNRLNGHTTSSSARTPDVRVSAKIARPRPFESKAGDETFEIIGRNNAPFGVRKSMDSLLRAIGLVRPKQGGSAEVQDPLVDCWAFYACVKAISDAVRSIPLRVWESDAEEAPEVSETHPLSVLLNNPNPYQDRADVIAAGIVHRKISGEDWWFLYDANSEPVLPMRPTPGAPVLLPEWANPKAKIPLPTWIVPVCGDYVGDSREPRFGRIQYVWHESRGIQVQNFGRASVVQFPYYDPRDPQRGLAPADVALRAISLGFQSERYQEAVMRGGGPGAFITYEEEMTNEEERRLQDEVNEGVKDPNVVGGLKVLSGKVKVDPNPATPKEMLQRETLDWVRDVVCSILQVPPPVIGVYDDATYNNLEGAYRQFYEGIRSELDAVATKINSHLIRRLDKPELARCVVSFDYSDVAALKQSNEKELKLAKEISTGTGLSFQDGCDQVGIETVLPETAKTILVPTAMQTLEQTIEGPKPPVVAQPQIAPPKKPKDLARALGRNPALTEPERRVYHEQLEIRVSAKFDIRLRKAALGWLRSFERATRRAINDFAENGPNVRRLGIDVVAKADAATEAEIDQLILLNQEEWAKALAAAAEQPIEGAFAAALADIAHELGVLQISMASPAVVAALSRQLIQLSEGVTSRLSAEIRTVILQAIAETSGVGAATLQNALVEALPALTPKLAKVFGTKEARANAIARTEIGHAVSTARMQQMKASGVTEIQWISSRDDHVRASHVELDGQIRTIGHEFKPHLRWPSDEEGPAGEVINCRCVAKAVIEEIVE